MARFIRARRGRALCRGPEQATVVLRAPGKEVGGTGRVLPAAHHSPGAVLWGPSELRSKEGKLLEKEV